MTYSVTACRLVSVRLHEHNGQWVLGAGVRPLYQHPVGGTDPLLPQASIRLRFLN